MKTAPHRLFAFAAFNDGRRRCGLRVRRVEVTGIFEPLAAASVEYTDGFARVGRVVSFAHLARNTRDLRAKIRAALNLSRVGPGFPAALEPVAKAAA